VSCVPIPKSGKKLTASGVSKSLYDFISDEAQERNVEKSIVIIDALNFYMDHRLTPERAELIIEEILVSKPELLEAPLERILEKKDSWVLDLFVNHVAAEIIKKQYFHQ
jgi:hypothetical protein